MDPNIAKQLQKALYFAYFYLKFRSRTRKELQNYLLKKREKYHFTDDIIEKALHELEEQHLIDDKNFIEQYVSSRTISKPKGELALRTELMKLGITKDLLDEYFLQQPLDQFAQAHQALSSRWQRFNTLDKKKRFEKAASFLLRRGFSFEIIKKTIAEMEEKEYNRC